ncbi:hypothetical protein AZA_30989 [Nitrospirillum viridazoti Y2]|nr:hypothetical protein AZA_30989 [Nitrospirillum amazonense Y2]
MSDKSYQEPEAGRRVVGSCHGGHDTANRAGTSYHNDIGWGNGGCGRPLFGAMPSAAAGDRLTCVPRPRPGLRLEGSGHPSSHPVPRTGAIPGPRGGR